MARVPSRPLKVLCVFCFFVLAYQFTKAEDSPSRKATFSIRPKAGGLFIASGKLKRHGFEDCLQGELGLKATAKHLGFELSLTGARDEASERLSSVQKKERKLKVNGLKLTATYEFNPLAGLKGHEREGNVYLGGGMGFYPFTEKIWIRSSDPSVGRYKLEDQDGFGYGWHLVLGGEYFFLRHLSVFGEVQYTYIDFDRQHRRNVNLYGFTLFGGISFKF